MSYCPATHRTERRKTRVVQVGSVAVGGDNPVRVQSMTTSPTRDVDATIEQAIRLADAGCEIVRVTVQGKKEAEACEHIKNGLVKRGYDTPLVADIHFYPPAAMIVADFVDKIRVNPGNFADKRATFQEVQDDGHALERVREKFVPLVEKCKHLKRALRIGTNHGSLSDRMMTRYGDSPLGMVESAIEYAQICRDEDFHNMVFSMKSSNPRVMIQAYRMLVQRMDELGWDYPLHLGVTEAGEGQEGRVKSSIGMGSLLLDGLGDTIRVSLTEDPWYEIPPCKELRDFAASMQGRGVEPFDDQRSVDKLLKRHVRLDERLPLHRDGTVWAETGDEPDARVPDDVELVPLRLAASTSRFAVNQTGPLVVRIEGGEPKQWQAIKSLDAGALVFAAKDSLLHEGRRFMSWMMREDVRLPVLWELMDTTTIEAASTAGALLADGLGEGLVLKDAGLGFQILQGCRMRATKTEFISCPSCGRTLFDLQEVSRRIREQTEHLPGVKIAIMGCIVNGPGEMADADFGYVGSRAGMVDLYVEKTCVERNIPMDEADGRLIELIKSHGRWVEKDASPATSSLAGQADD